LFINEPSEDGAEATQEEEQPEQQRPKPQA